MSNTDMKCPECGSDHTLMLRYPDTPKPGDRMLHCLDCHFEKMMTEKKVPTTNGKGEGVSQYSNENPMGKALKLTCYSLDCGYLECVLCPNYEAIKRKQASGTTLRTIPIYISTGESRYDALMSLQVHLLEFNTRFGTAWSLVAPKRNRREGAVVGKASDHNHLLYQDHLDAILAGVAKPITVEAIRQKLVDMGEKQSTAKLLSRDYFRLITKVIDPSTKRHRGAAKTLADWGTL